jgi:hypothetical protein
MSREGKKYYSEIQQELNAKGIDLNILQFLKTPALTDIECPACKKTLKAKSMGRHVRTIHLDDKPFVCGECNFKASNASNLRIHACKSRSVDKALETTSSWSHTSEYGVQIRLEHETGGRTVHTPVGYIDILSETEVIEIKDGSSSQSRMKAIGQVMAYSTFCPGKTKRIHLFAISKTPPHKLEVFMAVCQNLNIVVTLEHTDSPYY